MRKKRFWTVSPLFYFLAGAMFLAGVYTWRFNNTVAMLQMAIGLVCSAGIILVDVIYHRNISGTMRVAERVLSAQDLDALEHFALPVAVAARAGDVVWGNAAFSENLCGGNNFVGEDIQLFLYPRTSRQVMEAKGVPVTHRGREYTVYGIPAQEANLFYFVDDTYFKAVNKEYHEKRPVVCMVAFDNREEMVRDSVGGDDSRVTAEVEAVLRRFAVEEMGGFIRAVGSARYLLITDDAHMEKAKQKRFKVLDDVRQVKNSRGMGATISIGAGRGAESIAESENWARQALDMALGRGGDQVAVRGQGDNYEFFGGTSKGVENRDRVRTRVIAAALSDHVKSSDRIFIMGHKNSDLDSVGSAVGLWAAIHKGLEKPANIVVNRGQTLAAGLISLVEQNYPEERVFISPMEALQTATDRSLLIVTDTHSVNFVESGELLERIKRVVVIDHHRMMVSHINNALSFYHEPYASSASEMVAELVQYIKPSAINSLDAEALMSGIALDTKNFILNCGVRTFEALAFLRRRGADTVAVRKMFSNTLDSYKHKSQLVSSAEIYKGCAIATTEMEFEDMRVSAAQAADELMTITGVRASFVLFKVGNGVNISARSLGDVNVQVILENFGGGGHFTGAGAQLNNVSVPAARQMLVKALDEKLSDQKNN